MPEQEIEVPFERGVLRPWLDEDAQFIAVHLNTKDISHFCSDRIPHPYHLSDAEGWVRTCRAAAPGHQMAITLYGVAGPVGGIGVFVRDDVQRFTLELGYWLAVPYWGKGIMQQVLPAFLAHVWASNPQAARIEAQVYDYNARSVGLLRRFGFVQEGRLRRAAFKDGAFCDTLVFGLLRPHSDHAGGDHADSGAAAAGAAAADSGGRGGGG